MPQNKSTSRIAAITGKLAVALAVLLAPAILIAETISVTFDAALTNETGWSFNDKVGNNNTGYYLLQDAEVATPQFGFNITSVEIRVATTSSCNRNLIIRPGGNASSDSDCAFNTIPAGTTTNLFATWNTASPVRSFIIKSTVGSKGNLYIKSAVISGVPIIDAPTNLQADNIRGTRFRLSWTNPAGASSNRVDVSSVARRKASGETIEEYDFLAFTNTSVNAQGRLDDDRLLMGYPAFSGEKIYMAGLSTGVVQISSREDRGYLVYDRSRLAADDLTLVVSAKKHSSDTSGTWGLSVAQLDDGGTTNSLALLDLDYEFPSSPFTVPLPNCGTPCRLLLLPSDSAKGNRRILIDHLAFVQGYSPEAVETNVVKTAFVTDSTTYSVRGLCPRTEYVARITAFDADGNESSPSEPLAVTTNGDAIPFSIRIQ